MENNTGNSRNKSKGVWVFAEQREGKLMNVALELLGEGRRLADTLQTGLSAVLAGYNVAEKAQELFAYGADTVYLIEDEALRTYRTESYTAAVQKAVESFRPEILLLGATNIGRDLGPRLAASLHTGLTADCTALDIEPESRLLLQTRPAFGGNVMATIICPDHMPQMSTIRPGVMKKREPDAARRGKLVRVPYDTAAAVRTRVKEVVKSAAEQVDLTEAKIIVSGGRGLGGAEGFAAIRSAAEKLGGVVGASRAAVDAGWIDPCHQVGQTGTTVSPNVYIACGISGAIQHHAGISKSKCIIAINNNPKANIFKVADYGIVGDLHQVLPLVVEELQNAMQSR